MHVGVYVLYVCLCMYDYICMYVRVCVRVCVYVCKTKKLITQWHSDQPMCKSFSIVIFVHIVLFCI